MANNEQISTPGVFGGLISYDEEIGSKVKLSPSQVLWFVGLILLFVIGLKMFFPIA